MNEIIKLTEKCQGKGDAESLVIIDEMRLLTGSYKQALLDDFFKYFRDNGEKHIGMSIEQFVDEFIKQTK